MNISKEFNWLLYTYRLLLLPGDLVLCLLATEFRVSPPSGSSLSSASARSKLQVFIFNEKYSATYYKYCSSIYKSIEHATVSMLLQSCNELIPGSNLKMPYATKGCSSKKVGGGWSAIII